MNTIEKLYHYYLLYPNISTDTRNIAEKSIYFALYHFTSKPLAEAVIKRKFAGVNICGIIEDLSVEPHSVFRGLRNFGCNMRRSSRAGFLHSKYIIIDKEVVVTGSYNFSASAKRNNELVLIIKDKELASKFIREWQKNWRFYSLP